MDRLGLRVGGGHSYILVIWEYAPQLCRFLASLFLKKGLKITPYLWKRAIFFFSLTLKQG